MLQRVCCTACALLQYVVMDAAVAQDGEVLLLAVPLTAPSASSTAAQQPQPAPAATVTSTAATSTSAEHCVLVRMGYAASGVAATGATVAAAAESSESEFAPLHILEEIRYTMIHHC
jgi:hypothetical protein